MKCFYHNDMDGRCAGAVVAQFTGNYNIEDYFEVDYMMNLPLEDLRPDETVYLVDYSFKKDTVWQLAKILDMTNNVVWIDHHTSSLNLQKEMEAIRDVEFKSIKGIRQEEISGAALTYMYFNNCNFDDIPYYIKLVSDYDCWQYKFDPDTTHFKIGLETESYDALDGIWKNLSNEIFDSFTPIFTTLFGIRDKGKTIKGYIDRDNDSYRNQYAYESIIDGYRALVVNRKTNSWIFGDKYNEYPVVCVWAFNGNKFSYSIYSSDKTVDCSKIAESFGGGGHRGAAGFSSNELLFKKS